MLIEKINKLPISKAMKIIELFFKIYAKYDDSHIKTPFTISKYGEKEYVELLSKKMSIEDIEKNLTIMIPRTTFGVMKDFMRIGNELKETVQELNNMKRGKYE